MIYFQWTKDDQSLQAEGWKVDCQLQGAGVFFPTVSPFFTSVPRLILKGWRQQLMEGLKKWHEGSCTLLLQVSGVGYGGWKYDNTHDRRPREGRDWGLSKILTIQVDKGFSDQLPI